MSQQSKKPFEFNELSEDVKCKDCGKPLKKNIVARKERPRQCYACYWLDNRTDNIETRNYYRKIKRQNQNKYLGIGKEEK